MTQQVGSKRTRGRRSREQWLQLLTGQRASGLSILRYCERDGISEASFFRWRKLLGGEIAPAPCALAPIAKVPTRPKPNPRAADFIDLGIMGAAAVTGDADATRRGSEAIELRVEFGTGVVLTLTRR